MRLADLIVEQRDKQVALHAHPHLERDEEVIGWVRAREHEQRRSGYVFLTSRKLLIVWLGRADGHGAISWRDVDTWGVDYDAPGGPVLGVEAHGRHVFVHMPVGGHGTARRITSFLRRFAHLAPRPRRLLAHHSGADAYVADPEAVIRAERRSARDHTKRVVVTLIGILLIAVGALIAPIPGPWSLPLVIAGLAMLASEYDWAQDTLEWLKHQTRATRDKLKARRAGN